MITVIEVYRSVDKAGRQVLKARLSNGINDVIIYHAGKRFVGCWQVDDDMIELAYNKYVQQQA